MLNFITGYINEPVRISNLDLAEQIPSTTEINQEVILTTDNLNPSVIYTSNINRDQFPPTYSRITKEEVSYENPQDESTPPKYNPNLSYLQSIEYNAAPQLPPQPPSQQ